MEIILALVFISLVLVTLGLVLFFSRMKEGDFEHGDRLSLLPLDEDTREGTGQGNPPGKNTGEEDPEEA